jgi:hypothetical protein
MSKTQLVMFGSNRFWAYDVSLGVFLKHLIDAAEAREQSNEGWLSSAVSEWRSVAGISDFALMLPSEWSAKQREAFITLAEEACERLATRESIPAGEIVSWPLLEGLMVSPRGTTDVPTPPIVELGRAIISLISGQLPEAPKGQIWYYGTPTGRQTITLKY